jgi:hypothetical protein
LCNRDGCPIAIQVFDGNTADPRTLADQVAEVKQRFALARVVFVGDRGVVTSARIRADLQPVGLDWITALRAPSIQQLVEGGPLQLSLFDERDLAEITAAAYPGERRIVCRNPLLATERRRNVKTCWMRPSESCRGSRRRSSASGHRCAARRTSAARSAS